MNLRQNSIIRSVIVALVHLSAIVKDLETLFQLLIALICLICGYVLDKIILIISLPALTEKICNNHCEMLGFYYCYFNQLHYVPQYYVIFCLPYYDK